MLLVQKLTPGRQDRVTEGSILVQEEVFGPAVDEQGGHHLGSLAAQARRQRCWFPRGPADAVLPENRGHDRPQPGSPRRTKRIDLEPSRRDAPAPAALHGSEDARMTRGC